jgi:type IV pilus assembly protein PilQ
MQKGTGVVLLALLGAYDAVGQPRPATTPVPPPAAGAVIVLDRPAPRRFTGETISLDLKDADIRDVLKVFAKIGRFNLAIDPEVRGSVTVRLQNVPWDQALDVILRMNGLGYTLEGRILRTGTPARLADP